VLIWAATGVLLIHYFVIASEYTHHELLPARSSLKAIVPICFQGEPTPIR
jgi:hypothetical protein